MNQAQDEQGEAAAAPARRQRDLASSWVVDAAYGSNAFFIFYLLIHVATGMCKKWRGMLKA